ncbi:hypothetical protein F2Q69_00020683 [Brassica cretica]|uniref:Uncharacterized protein n=1 Tax=Brassica cretica TaxID=69181 RepID=A0A8S9QCY1_BRACR|nr:hypothetical protein F2Q69_00020683 [Brassica cretica]
MANLSSGFQTFTMDDPITQLAELNNTLHQFQKMFAPPFSSSLESLFFHHHQNQQYYRIMFPGNLSTIIVFIKRLSSLLIFTTTTSLFQETIPRREKNYCRPCLRRKTVSLIKRYLPFLLKFPLMEPKIIQSYSRRVRSKSREEEKEREVVHVRVKRGQTTDSQSLAERLISGGIAAGTYNDFKEMPVAMESRDLLDEAEGSNSEDVFGSNPTEVAPSLE